MSELPTFISTAQAPRSTGVGSPIYVENVDPMGKAIGKGGEVVTDIQQQMVKTQNAQAVNHAKLGATIKLNNLTTRLAKENPTTVGQIAEAEIQKIYNEETSGLSETARQAFDAIFTPLHGQARANIQAQAVKTHNDEQVAGLVRLLAGLKKTHDPIKTPISTKTNFGIGAKAITDAVNGRNITAEEGAKLLIKFRNELSEQGVKRWINSQTSDTLMKAYHQMDQGKIKNLAIRRLWDQLDDDKKGKLRQDAVTEWSRLGAQVDKAEARKVKQAQKSARRDIFTVLDTATSEKDRNAAMERLRDNPEGLSPNQFRQLLDDVAGRTDQFNDDDVVNGISTRILEGDPNLTEKEIATAGGVNFATKKRLIKELREAENAEFAQAKEIINTSPVFMPKSKADKLVYGDAMKAAKAKLLTQVIEQRNKALKDKKNFDAIGVTNALIKALVDNGDTRAITQGQADSARSYLESKGIDLSKSPSEIENAITRWKAQNPGMGGHLAIDRNYGIFKGAQ